MVAVLVALAREEPRLRLPVLEGLLGALRGVCEACPPLPQRCSAHEAVHGVVRAVGGTRLVASSLPPR